MPNVLMTEAPGGLGEAFQCTYCGATYLAHEVVEGEVTDKPANPPRLCRRCNAPMDYEAALKFADVKAAEAAAAPTRASRRFKAYE